MIFIRLLKSSSLISLAFALGLVPTCRAQDDSANKSWSQSSQQASPNGALNPTRTRQTHTESGGRIVDKTSVESLGPDGRYIPYQDTEKESVRVDATTTRSIERTFGTGPDGQRTLIQERQEESRSLPGGEQKVIRTVSNPDADGKLQLVQRELQDSKQSAPGVRETKTTVLTPDAEGGLTAAVQIEERQKQSSDGTVEFKKSTLLSDGAGHWQLSEVREGTSKEGSGQGRTQEERVLRPDADGKLVEVERTISKQTAGGPGEKRDTVETYSTNVPGIAGTDALQLVQRETTVRRITTAGEQRSIRQIERPSPGNPTNDLHVTDEVIDIVRPGGSGGTEQKRTILTQDSNGSLGEVWVYMGKTTNPSAIQVDTRTSTKPQ
jgi:hypothetical protein